MNLLTSLNAIANASVGGINLAETFKNSSFLVNLMLVALILASVASWALIIYKFFQYQKAKMETQSFIAFFWKNDDMKEVYNKSLAYKNSPVASIYSQGYIEQQSTRESWEKLGVVVVGSKVDDLIGNVERAMRRESHARMQLLENGLQFLATVATASPFVGLFGTVYGIMNAFTEIGKTGSATLGSIAPHLSDALVTTAFGLIAAIPASIAFNYFNAKLQKFENESVNVTADFINQIKRSNI